MNKTTTDDFSSETLTLEKLDAVIKKFSPPVLYYGISEFAEKGSLFYCKKSDSFPECIICHPDDFVTVKHLLSQRRLVHIRNEPMEGRLERLRRSISSMYSFR